MKRFAEKDIKTQIVSDFGMTIELFIETGNKDTDQSVEYPLLKIYADETTEKKYLEIPSGEGFVQIPLDSVTSFIEAGKTEVHSESWYDKNVFDQDGNK